MYNLYDKCSIVVYFCMKTNHDIIIINHNNYIILCTVNIHIVNIYIAYNDDNNIA